MSGSVAVGQLELDEDKNQSFDDDEEEDDSVTLVDLTGSGGGLVGE